MSAKITKVSKFDVTKQFERLPDEMKTNDSVYESLVEAFIRERYSVSAELAILRQRDTKPEEFERYNLYAEECKLKAKSIINKGG